MPSYAVCVKEDYVWVVRRHIDEGQGVSPGMPLVDVMTPEGVVETIISENWGIVAFVQGKRIHSDKSARSADKTGNEYLCADDDSTLIRYNRDWGSVYGKNDIICHIVAREQQGTKKSGLHPRPSGSLRRRRLALAA